MSINDATNVAAAAISASSAVKKSVAKTLTNNIIGKTFQNLTRKRYKCYYGKAFNQLPDDELSELSSEVLACYSGPDNGIGDVSLVSHRRLLHRQSSIDHTNEIKNNKKLNNDQSELSKTLAEITEDNENIKKKNDNLVQQCEGSKQDTKKEIKKEPEVKKEPELKNGSEFKKEPEVNLQTGLNKELKSIPNNGQELKIIFELSKDQKGSNKEKDLQKEPELKIDLKSNELLRDHSSERLELNKGSNHDSNIRIEESQNKPYETELSKDNQTKTEIHPKTKLKKFNVELQSQSIVPQVKTNKTELNLPNEKKSSQDDSQPCIISNANIELELKKFNVKVEPQPNAFSHENNSPMMQESKLDSSKKDISESEKISDNMAQSLLDELTSFITTESSNMLETKKESLTKNVTNKDKSQPVTLQKTTDSSILNRSDRSQLISDTCMNEASIKTNSETNDKKTIQVNTEENKKNCPNTKSNSNSDAITSAKNNVDHNTLIPECRDSFSKSNIMKWNISHENSYGIASSLYENNFITRTTVGDPIADVFSVLTRQNSSIMILADGVNWGPRSRLAARCAVRACMNYINNQIFFPSTNESTEQVQKKLSTHDVFTIMMKSFDAAQEFILQKKGTMTTLCCSVVLKLKDSNSSTTPLWAVCTLSIGDSTAYVFNKEKGVLELTYGARNINDDRDMRNVGGALGHVYGRKPDVSNLNYSLMYIKEGDIVFLVSDGISDNFDPCVSQTAIRKPQNDEKPNLTPKVSRSNSQSHGYIHRNSLISFASNAFNSKKNPSQPHKIQKKNQIALSSDDQKITLSTLPQLSPNERYLCGLAHMNEVLSARRKNSKEKITASETCSILMDHVMKVTTQKRNLLEKGLVEGSELHEEEKAKFQISLKERAAKLRGKLDHASIVAYDVGICKN